MVRLVEGNGDDVDGGKGKGTARDGAAGKRMRDSELGDTGEKW
jgi:hypothetical protein